MYTKGSFLSSCFKVFLLSTMSPTSAAVHTMHVHARKKAHTHAHVHTRARTHTRACVYIHTHTHTHLMKYFFWSAIAFSANFFAFRLMAIGLMSVPASILPSAACVHACAWLGKVGG